MRKIGSGLYFSSAFPCQEMRTTFIDVVMMQRHNLGKLLCVSILPACGENVITGSGTNHDALKSHRLIAHGGCSG